MASRSVECGPTVARRSSTSWRGSPPVPRNSPALVATSTRRWSRTRRVTIDATASTATSNDSASWPSGCTSSTTAARERQRASFWRIMRSPVRAVERQWTRRRSSPSSYSRSVRNSSPRSLTIARGAGQVALPGDPAADRDRCDDVVRRVGARARRCRPRSATRGERGRTDHSPRARAARRGTAPAGAWGRGTQRGRWRPRPAAERGSAPPGDPRRTSRSRPGVG